jgi:hypothetical protein
MAVLGILALSHPAGAITHGTIDAVHTFAGAVIFKAPPGVPIGRAWGAAGGLWWWGSVPYSVTMSLPLSL